MIYTTKPVQIHSYSVSWEDILYDRAVDQQPINVTTTNTITRVKNATEFGPRNLRYWVEAFSAFNAKYFHLIHAEKSSLYNTFYIPKKNSKKMRRIDAPKSELMTALYELKSLLEALVPATHHQAAYA